MLALINNINFMELGMVALGALLVFGKRLPEVALRGAAQLVKLRRSLKKMWAEAGIDSEIKKVKEDLKSQMPDLDKEQLLEAAADHVSANEQSTDAASEERTHESSDSGEALEPFPGAAEAVADSEPEPAGQDNGRYEDEPDEPSEEARRRAETPDVADESLPAQTGSDAGEESPADTKESA